MFKKDRFSIRKIKGVVGSVFLGSLLMAPSVVDAATYHYVNKEIISQEAKDLIQTGKKLYMVWCIKKISCLKQGQKHLF
ncbi:hypothetical protein RK986_01325 [Streptococcus pneumoniae]|nr:hypothetical protein [Streptococcus pneumoniae]